ncbi:MAG TPA: alpha/beta hydrolase [Ramlibacter sp.]|nr:alpha/beta hydrolase [Ramlibacter sp.]
MTPRFPNLDPDLAAVAARLQAGNFSPAFRGSVQPARDRMQAAAASARALYGVPAVATTEDRTATHDGLEVPVRIYRPHSANAHLPTVVFFHGGGFALGSVELMDDIARKLCRDLEAVIVSVDYRLAPEHRFPAAHDDAVTATSWACAAASELGGDRLCVAVAGESAGANLAAYVAIAMRDRGVPLAAQLLIVPGVDFARDTQKLEQDGRSYPMLTPSDLRDIARLYLGAAEDSAACVPPSPMHCKDLGGLAPAVVAVAGWDPLCEEGLEYARRLQRAGVATQVLRYDAMFHPFFGFFEVADAARRANDEICRVFRSRLESTAL